MHQSQKAIHANQNEEVDATIDIHINACVDDFAHEQTKSPSIVPGYVDSPEGQTSHEHEVSSSQVAQVDLSHGAGLLMEAENHHNKQIKHNPQHRDDQDINRHDGDDPFCFLSWRTISCCCVVLGSIYGFSEVSRDATEKEKEGKQDKTLK